MPITKFACLVVHLLAAFLCGASQSIVNAEVIAEFSFEGNDYYVDPQNEDGVHTGLNLLNSAQSVNGIAVSALQFSPSLNSTRTLGFAANDYDNALGFSTDFNNDRIEAVSDQAVFFQIDVQAGYQLDIDALSFDSLKTRGNEASAARATYSIFVNPAGDPSAAGGLAGAVDFIDRQTHDHGAPGTFGAETTGNSFSTGRLAIDVPGDRFGAFKNLTGTQTIAIRLAGSEGVDQDFGIDNLVLSGQVTAIPEPAGVSALLFGVAMVTISRRRRR